MQSISRHHVMSSGARSIATKALEQLSKHPTEGTPTLPNALKTGKIAFAEMGNHKFSYQGFDLYSLASDDDSVPTIWKKETVRDPKTGTEMEWLVAYTTDDDDIMQGVLASQKTSYQDTGGSDFIQNQSRVVDKVSGKQGTMMNDVRVGIDTRALVLWDGAQNSAFVDPQTLTRVASQKMASANAALRAVAEPKLPKNQAPIAPGVVNKNLTIDQGGQGGKATVTVDFNDPAKGEDFFKQIEDLTSEVGGTTTAPAVPKEEKPESTPPAAEGAPAGNEAKEPAPPTPTPAGAPMAPPMASTVKTLTHYGSKIVTIIAEQFDGYAEQYHFVNEDGKKVALNLTGRVKVGSQIVRPDNNEKIRVIGYETVQAKSDDDFILSKLGVDISDKVPPMGWTNKDSQNENDEAGNDPLPPNPALQENAPPTADTANQQPPAYDSTKAEGEGTKQRFNMSVNPNDNSVTVKFEKPPALDAIDQAVQGQQPQLNEGVTPQAPQQQQPMAGGQQQTQQKNDFNEASSPIQF